MVMCTNNEQGDREIEFHKARWTQHGTGEEREEGRGERGEEGRREEETDLSCLRANSNIFILRTRSLIRFS